MRISMFVFGTVMACFFSVGKAAAVTPKGNLDVDKALKKTVCQYLSIRDRLKDAETLYGQHACRNGGRCTFDLCRLLLCGGAVPIKIIN